MNMALPLLSDLQWAALLWMLAMVVATWAILRRPRTSIRIDRSVSAIGAGIGAIFLILALQAARLQVFQQRAFADRTGADPVTGDVRSDPRRIDSDLTYPRGPILAADGTVLAETEIVRGIAYRRYADPALSSITGYFSALMYGKAGIEKALDGPLTRDASLAPWSEVRERLNRAEARGYTVELTIDPNLQALAYQLLDGRIGAAVVMDCRTGAVRALASRPSIDPGQLVASDAEEVERARAYWEELNQDNRQPLVQRATDGLYTPGSTFKLITTAAAIEENLAAPDSVYFDDGELIVDGYRIVEANRPDPSVVEWTLEEGIAYSLNVVLAQVGLDLGADRLTDYAKRFGFESQVPFEIPVVMGQVASSPEVLESPAALAATSFGQGELLTTPLHMALIGAAFANSGAMPDPTIVSRIVDHDGAVVSEHEPSIWRRPVSHATADTVRDMMIAAVTYGSGVGAALPGMIVGGKTGTAETGDAMPHAWFVGFAGRNDPEIVVSVVLEHGATGGGQSVQIARELMAAALSY
jgi:penicillin-binding protein A